VSNCKFKIKHLKKLVACYHHYKETELLTILDFDFTSSPYEIS